MQRINFITQFFLRYCKETANLLFRVFEHAWPHTPKMIIGIWRNLWRLSVGKRTNSSSTFSLRYYKDYVNLLFWLLWASLTTQTQSDYYYFCVHLQAKNQLNPPSPPMLFWRYCKVMQTSYFGYFGYASFHTQMIVSTCRRLICLSTCQK